MAFCTKCGAQVPDGTPICPACGAPITTAPQQPAPQPIPQQPAPQQPIPQQQAPQGQFTPPPAQPYQQQPNAQQYYAKLTSAGDHTSEFTQEDTNKHKVIAALFYSLLLLTFFVSIDGWGLTSMFTSLINACVAMFTGGFRSGDPGIITEYAMIGFFIAAGMAVFKESAYVKFHGRQAFKIMFLSIITYLVRIIPVAGPVLSLLCSWIVLLIAAVSIIFVFTGKSKEPIILSAFFKE